MSADPVKDQGELVRKLKADKSTDPQVLKQAIEKLKALKAETEAPPALSEEAKEREAARKAEYEWKEHFESLMTRKFFYVPSFEIYGSVGGLFDFGPPGCAVRQNILDAWRRHFVMAENMLEVNTTCLTPESVLQTSGHVEKFTDFMVRDTVTLDCHRADKLLESHIEQLLLQAPGEEKEAELRHIANNADAYSQEELGEMLKRLGVVAPDTGNPISDPFPFNLMFATSIGPTGRLGGFLRPETAQGIFVNFRRLLEYNRHQMPFAAAQIGLGFRNEISPRSGLLRVREFPMAEIEHFVDPEDKSHPKFKYVKDLKLKLLSAEDQIAGRMDAAEVQLGTAVETGLIDNETLAYFMARSQLFMVKIGVDPEKLRFRQHKSNEMAHYAKDCWDAEIWLHSHGWVEVAGHADRSAYDLRQHSAARKVDLSASVDLAPENRLNVPQIRPNHKALMAAFGKDVRILQKFWKDGEMTEAQAKEMLEKHKAGESYELPVETEDGCTKTFTLDPDMVKDVKWKKVGVRRYIPSVIEPSFGIGRILYSVLEHSFYRREDDPARQVLRLPSMIAPHKAAVFTLLRGDDATNSVVERLEQEFLELGMDVTSDNSGTTSIGKKYSRADEIGIPFNITVEKQQQDTVTVRERDTTTQTRIPVREVVRVVHGLVQGFTTWQEVLDKYGVEAAPVKE